MVMIMKADCGHLAWVCNSDYSHLSSSHLHWAAKDHGNTGDKASRVQSVRVTSIWFIGIDEHKVFSARRR